MRRFTADEVRSVFFLIMLLVWLPDYVIGHNGHAWWKDDDVPFSAGGSILGDPRAVLWGRAPDDILVRLLGQERRGAVRC